MGDLSKHFSRQEFRCKCGNDCGCDTVDIALINALEAIRLHFGEPVMVTSGHRCRAHNIANGGVDASMHLMGKAADIFIPGVHAHRVYEYFDRKYFSP